MKHLYDKQAELAQHFVAANKDLVDQVTEVATQQANDFMQRIATRVLPAAEFAALQTLLAQGELFDFNLQLRQRAVAFVCKQASGCFWLLFDGISMLYDATHGNWPYMSSDRRSACLSHASDLLNFVKIAIEQEFPALDSQATSAA